jgi:short subunit dehydrogenase-like uncharacterized protein
MASYKSVVQNFLKNRANQHITGPNQLERERARSYLWGQVTNPAGKTFTARLQTMEAYALTAQTVVLAVESLDSEKLSPGFKTPSLAFGADFILRVQGSVREDIVS